MKKRDVREGIKEWLNKEDNSAKGSCPFRLYVATRKTCSLCEKYFPRVTDTWSVFHLCPCGQYSLAHVRRIAQKILKDLEGK